MRWDTFTYAGEADMLECRLTELQDIPDLTHVIVEADVTFAKHQPKPYHYLEQQERFAKWSDRIVYVKATGLPDSPDAWAREHAQRELALEGLKGAEPDDIVLHSDVDEIPTDLAVRYVEPAGYVRFQQAFHPFAVDWLHPHPWFGTVAARCKHVSRISEMRDARNWAPTIIPNAGWHFSWVSDTHEQKLRKLNTFSHAELVPVWDDHLEDCIETGMHVDGVPLKAITDGRWPRWITEGHAPRGWFRPDELRPRADIAAPQILARR